LERPVIKYIYDTAMCLPVNTKVRAWVTASYVHGVFLQDASTFYWRPDITWIDK
jgi:hypothetical protein